MKENGNSRRLTWNARTIAVLAVGAIVFIAGYLLLHKSDPPSSSDGGSPIHISPASVNGASCEAFYEDSNPCDFALPQVVASPGTGSFAVFYESHLTELFGRQVSAGSISSPRVLRSVQTSTSGIGLSGGLGAISVSGGRYAWTTARFAQQQRGYRSYIVPVGLTSFQILPSDLAPAGQPQEIQSHFTPAQQPTALAEGAGGRFLVAQSSAQGQPMAIHILDRDGHQLRQSSIPARSAYGGTAGYPVAATYDSADGAFLVAWANGGEGVLLQALDANGRRRGGPVRVSSDPSGVATIELVYNPQLHKSLLVWATNLESNPHAPAVDGRVIDGPGRGLGPLVDFAGDNGSDSIQAAADGGKFLVSWLGGTNSAITTTTYDPAAPTAPTPHAVWSVPPTKLGLGASSNGDVLSVSWDLDPTTGKGFAAWDVQDHEILGQYFGLPG